MVEHYFAYFPLTIILEVNKKMALAWIWKFAVLIKFELHLIRRNLVVTE